jgi:predicted amidohydrolase
MKLRKSSKKMVKFAESIVQNVVMLKISLVQSAPEWENVEANLRRAEERLAESDASLVVFPEMFTTGFTMNAAAVAESMSGNTVARLGALAARYGKAVMGSMVVADDGHYLNRMLFVRPDGGVEWYDKRHLFRMGGERDVYTAGNERAVWEWQGVRILPLICYDLRFPVWSRNRGDYDMIVVAASWPAPRATVWRTLLKARAIENLCYVAGVNRTGSDPNASYSGDAALIDFLGVAGSEADGQAEQAVEGVVDLEAQRAFREKFPAHLDADGFSIET